MDSCTRMYVQTLYAPYFQTHTLIHRHLHIYMFPIFTACKENTYICMYIALVHKEENAEENVKGFQFNNRSLRCSSILLTLAGTEARIKLK